MEYKIGYKVQNKMNAPCPSLVTLDDEIGRRFDRFAYERSSSPFALREILREPMLAMCYVTLDDGVEPITYTMCDYASAANLTTFDPFYFTVFV